MSAAADHCSALVREHDRDRYLASLFAPDGVRPHLLALYAFDAEVRRIPEAVSEPQIGLIRLQWWHDTLDAIYGGSADTGHPVADALAEAIARGSLPPQALHDLVTAHEFDLFSDRMTGITELEGYLGETCSRVIQMAAMLLDRESAPSAAEAAGLAGVAQGLARLLGDPQRREQFLPPGMDLGAAIAHARRRLEDARACLPQLPKSVLPAFLPASLAGLYLDRTAKYPEQPVTVSHFRRQLSLWWYARKDRF